MAMNSSRVLLSFDLPRGSLLVTIASPTKETDDHVFVCNVDAKSPVFGLLQNGDQLVSINGIDVKGKGRDFCAGIFRATSQIARTLTVSRYKKANNSSDRVVTVAASSKENVQSKPANRPKPKSKPIPPKKQAPVVKKKKTPKHAPLPFIEYPDVLPEPGFVCKKQMYYSTKNDETLALVAEKLGTEWKIMAALPQNTSRYGTLKGNTRFQAHTLLYIGEKRSQWKMKQLSIPENDEIREECVQCGVASNPAELLLCDGCDSHHHVRCVGLTAVPEGDWFCSTCCSVLQARKEHLHDPKGLPKLPPLQVPQDFAYIQQTLQSYMCNRRSQELEVLSEIAAATQQLWRHDIPRLCDLKRQRIEVKYAALLGEDILPHETLHAFKKREPRLRYLGRVFLADDGDVLAMNMLREPDELIITVPFDGADQEIEPSIGKSYSVFARVALFDKNRDDELPLDKNGVRDAQRRLFHLLLGNEANKAMIVTRAVIPPTVKIRATDDDNSSRCFDLSELVRDCECDLDLPREPTPPVMAKNGLQLRDYQQGSLRWLLDKEMESNGLGLAGEFWHRLRFQDPTADGDYFYCELTGSVSLDIFNFRNDVQQTDASLNQFSMPTGGVLGDEMGLGKTVISLTLIVQNPPPLHLRVLPREYTLGKQAAFNHPEYLPPPNAGKKFLSNGTLIIVPTTLLSQWQTEIERFAPHLSVITLHNEENPTTQAVASSDVVIVTTFLLQKTSTKKGTRNLLACLKRIHFHRLFLDESTTQGVQTKLVLAALSATHRHSITGTPVGSQLSDLYGQVRFLKLAPFNRDAFWKNLIEDPYYERNDEALRVLRSLLSRIIVRHSKRQTKANGEALLALPPRTVETVLLQFGSEAEKEVYQSIENRCKQHFMEMKKESTKTVASHYIELIGLATSLRQAAAHPSIVSLEKLDRFNQNVLQKKNKNKKKDTSDTTILDTTRAGILQLAVSRARPSAKRRMRVAVNQYQNIEDLLECPVCFDIVDEREIVLPACAHPVCRFCIGELLGAANSTSREASAHCPSCRDLMRRSEITYLGDASDAGAVKAAPVAQKVEENSNPVPVTLSLNGFQMTQIDVHVQRQVAGASTVRAGHTSLSDSELLIALRKDRALLHTLDEKLVRSHYDCEGKVGTKIARLLYEVNTMMSRNALSKCVVFSQFLGVLDVAMEELMARNIGCVRIDGSLKQHERADALMTFSSNPNVKVCLLSMRSGAVGLNLQVADHVFIMDVAANSAIEEQSIDRVHRPAVSVETRQSITVKRFVIESTVEERLLGARRPLGVDQTAVMAGTEICGIDGVGCDEGSTERPSKRARTDEGDSGARQKRVEMLEALFGCAPTKVHKA